MNRSSIYVTALALVLALYVTDSRAQQRSPSQSTPPSSTSPRSSTPSTRQSTTSSTQGTAQAFVQQVYEDNQKEIEVSRMANTKAQAKEVKDYAKQLVDDHTKSQDKLRKYAMEKNITLRSTSTSSTRSSQDTLGGTRNPSSTPSARNEPSTSPESRQNEPSPGTRRTAPGQGAQTGRSDDSTAAEEQHEVGSARTQSGSYEDSHLRELSSKSGAEFDRAYIQMMIDDHEKAVSLFERQKEAKLGDSELQGFVNDQLSVLKKHLSKAQNIEKNLQKNLNSSDSKSDSSRRPSTSSPRTPSNEPSRTPSTNPPTTR